MTGQLIPSSSDPLLGHFGVAEGEALVVDDGRWSLRVRPGVVLRPARAEDAPAIAELFVEAGRIGWSGFLPREQLEGIVPEPQVWAERIATAGAGHPATEHPTTEHSATEHPATEYIVVADDEEGVAGFIWVRGALDPDLDEPVGEVATFYTHPRVWGTGIGRRLMALGLDLVRALGYHECVLWTEERNERPRRIYALMGWTLDGRTRSRDFHGIDITETRHRMVL